MQYLASITDQRQLTIPKKVLEKFGIDGRSKVVITVEGDHFKVYPARDLLELAGSLKTSVVLTDAELEKARDKIKVEL